MIYIVRHGQTEWNFLGKVQGFTDNPLNEKGLQQAKEIAEKLKSFKFDAVFSSPLIRARKTCETIYDGSIFFDDRIKERGYGDFEGESGKSFSIGEYWNIKTNLNANNVETMLDFEKRIFSFFDDLLKKYPNKNILVVCHGGVIRAAKGYFWGRPSDGDYYKTYGYVDNVSVTEFQNKRG